MANNLITTAEKMSDIDYLREEFERYKGQFIITPDFTVERLLAMVKSTKGEQQEYFFMTFNGKRASLHKLSHGNIFITLAGIDRNKYKKLMSIAKLSHHDQPSIFGTNKKDAQAHTAMIEFNMKIKQQAYKICEGMQLLTEICWQIN